MRPTRTSHRLHHISPPYTRRREGDLTTLEVWLALQSFASCENIPHRVIGVAWCHARGVVDLSPGAPFRDFSLSYMFLSFGPSESVCVCVCVSHCGAAGLIFLSFRGGTTVSVRVCPQSIRWNKVFICLPTAIPTVLQLSVHLPQRRRCWGF